MYLTPAVPSGCTRVGHFLCCENYFMSLITSHTIGDYLGFLPGMTKPPPFPVGVSYCSAPLVCHRDLQSMIQTSLENVRVFRGVSPDIIHPLLQFIHRQYV